MQINYNPDAETIRREWEGNHRDWLYSRTYRPTLRSRVNRAAVWALVAFAAGFGLTLLWAAVV